MDGDILLVIPKPLSSVDSSKLREDLRQFLGFVDQPPMKTLKIRVFNRERTTFHVWIRPGIRPGDVCLYLNILEHVLVPADTSTEDLPIEIYKNK